MIFLNSVVAIVIFVCGVLIGSSVMFDWEAYFEYKKDMYKLHLTEQQAFKQEGNGRDGE